MMMMTMTIVGNDDNDDDAYKHFFRWEGQHVKHYYGVAKYCAIPCGFLFLFTQQTTQ